MKNKKFNINGILVYCLMALTGFAFACDKNDDEELLDNEITFNNIELLGSNEIPAVTTNGSGTLSATYNRSTKILSYTFNWTLGNTDDNTVGIHFHGPALVTENAPIVIPVENFPNSHTGSVSGETRALTDAEEAQLLDGRWYLNIHSDTYPDGELRGNLLRGEP